MSTTTGEIPTENLEPVVGRDFTLGTTEPVQQEIGGTRYDTVRPMSPEEQWGLQRSVFADKKKEKPDWQQRKPSRHGSEDRQQAPGTDRNIGGQHGEGESTEHGKIHKGPKSNPGGKGH